MTSIVFNGSYITKKNTGIGVVSKGLLNSLSSNSITTLIPKDIGIRGDIYIPNNLSPGSGLQSHFRRLYWLQNSVPKIMNDLKADYFMSPLLEAPLFTNINSITLAHDLIPIRQSEMPFTRRASAIALSLSSSSISELYVEYLLSSKDESLSSCSDSIQFVTKLVCFWT